MPPGGFAALQAEHEAAWAVLLQPFVIEFDASSQAQLILNLHVFHLLQTLTTHTAELDAGVPARGLHGEGYRGHVFWDELFVLPLLNSRLPSLARELIDYRWRRLGAARDAARAAGLKGALFPWQSGGDGTEQTPKLLFNRLSGHWMPDYSRLQRHVGLAVAYNAWQYFEATQDRGWLTGHGAEIIVDVARLFASMAEFDPAEDRFHLRGVMGPDEYHTGHPGSPGGGLDDNAYTNIMAAWVFDQAVWIMHSVQGFDMEELRARLLITAAEIEAWEHLSRRMFVPFHDDGVISQFDGYVRLRELDWKHYRRTYGLIERLDLILEAEGDSTNHYRLAKQADVLMLLYVLGEDQLIQFLARMGYTVTPAQMAATVDFYLARTAHGSTLSRVAHASVLAQRDPEKAWATFREALDADLDDTQGGTTRSGIHLGAMAGTIDVVQRSFAGLRITRDALDFAPRLPAELSRVDFRVRYRDQMLAVHLERDRLRVSAAPGDAAPVLVRVGTRRVLLRAGQEHEFLLKDGLTRQPRTCRLRGVHPQHGRTRDPVLRQVQQSLVRGRERIGHRGGAQRDLCGDAEELLAVGPGVGRDAAQLAFLEQLRGVVQRRDVTQVDTGHGEGAAPVQGTQGHRNQVAGRSEEDGGIQRIRRLLLGAPGEGRAQLKGQAARFRRPRHHVHAGAPVEGDLCRQMRGSAEAVDPQPAADGQLGAAERAVADDPRAQQGRRLLVREARREPVGEVLGHGDEFRVAAVAVPAREHGGEAEVLFSAQAEAAGAAGPAEPGHPDPVAGGEPRGAGPARHYFADDLVARNDAGAPRGEVTLGQMQVRAAHSAGPDPHQHLPGARPGIGALIRHEWAASHRPGLSYPPGSHGRPPLLEPPAPL